MGAAVIGGLFASTALSLFVVPVIYTIFDDFEHAVRRLFRKMTGRAPAEPATSVPATPVAVSDTAP
jgi:hypothetical protein